MHRSSSSQSWNRVGPRASASDEVARSLSHLPAQHFPKARTGHRRRLLHALLVVPFLLGVIAVPAVAPSAVSGDELSDAQAQQKALARRIAEQKALVAQISHSQDLLAGRIDDDQGRARRHHPGPERDAAQGQRADRRHRRGPRDVRRPRPRPRGPRPPAPAHRAPGGAQEGRAPRPQGRARQPHPRGLRGGTDVPARDLPVRRDVHGHARRHEQPARRRRAGPGARPADRPRPRDADLAPPDRRGHARGDQPASASRRRSRSRSSTAGSTT